MLNIPDDIMYEALLNKDPEYEGLFFVGVKTTSIFCRPTCTARKPKRINVEFFETTKEALELGYRPCKVCRPLEQMGTAPEWLKPLLEAVRNRPDMRFKNYELADLGFQPDRVRRWFKKHHNMTFQTYLRLLRLGKAFGLIKEGSKVIESAFDSGYESLSGFNDSFKKMFGESPKNSKAKTLVKVTRILTPLGPMLAGANDDGIVILEFVDRRMIETQIKRLRKLLNAEFLPGESKYFKTLKNQLSEYFEGKRKIFTVPIVVPGTEFQKKVWKVLQTIPYGTTRSYKEQAELINNPKAVRAVARANGDNRIAIIIPCHRVIGSDGKLVGYGGGIWRKEHMLNLEIANK